jgi:hypothetical protein
MIRKLQIFTLLLLSMTLSFGSVTAQSVINYLPESTMSKMTSTQKHYLDQAMKSRFATDVKLATIEMELLEQNLLVFNYNDIPYTAHKNVRREGVRSLTRISWIGDVEGWNGQVHLVYNKSKKTVSGLIEAESVAFVITPLGDGLHAIIGWDMIQEEGCETPDNGFVYRGDNPAVKGDDYGNTDLINSQDAAGGRATGECNIRVLVAYTDDVDDNRLDILSDIYGMINTANTGYSNSSGVTFSIELAMAYEVSYAETGNMNTDLDALTSTSDLILDDIHTQRNLWDADQCVLLTANGTGLAWLSTDFENQFSVTGEGNFFAHTFHHELGHNAECSHAINQSSQPGSAPYAGYGEPTTGCFRTVLAYQDACGTGTCPRQNIFSDNDVNSWSCGGSDYTPGTSNNRNQDRLNLSRGTLNAHNTVPVDGTFAGDYNWSTREAVHWAGSSTLTYSSSTNQFELFSGSEGSFRASDGITLGEGFHARSGSEFTAYLETCTPLAKLSADQEEGIVAAQEEASTTELNAFPNPFNNKLTVTITTTDEENYSVYLIDVFGKIVQSIAKNETYTEGTHLLNLKTEKLASGIYMLVAQSKSERIVKRLSKTGY